MLNIVDEQEIIVGCVGVMKRFRKFAFDFRLSRRNVENVMEVVIYRATWTTFKPKPKKIKNIHPQKISYISGNGTF